MNIQIRYLLVNFVIIAFVLAPSLCFANPEGGVVAAGEATILESGSNLTINQASDRAVIDWRNFDIAPNEATQFNQPSSDSVTLNRIHSDHASTIAGKLTANGNIVLVNQNGFLFTKDAVVDVNGIIATTSDIENDKFMQGKMEFTKPGNADAMIINEGKITAKQAGLVGMVAPQVINNGYIVANGGRVQLSSGDTFTVDLYGDKLMEVAVSKKLKRQLVRNRGIIKAKGGKILLTASAGKEIVDGIIEVEGELKAPAAGIVDGEIVIYAEGSNAVPENIPELKNIKKGKSKVTVAAKLNASGINKGEKGGKIRILADEVTIKPNSIIDASGLDGLTGTTEGFEVSAERIGSAGGDIRIGGDYKGAGTTPTAEKLIVEPGAEIYSDSLSTGDAGRNIFWADGETYFYGNSYARALGQTGDGGFVETSGHNSLIFDGIVEANSKNGSFGTWLLDPSDITIGSASNGLYSVAGGTYTATASGATMLASTIQTALNAGTNVTVVTNSPTNGFINLTSGINVTSNSANLTFSAYTDILINASLAMNGGSLTLTADNAGNQIGAIVINSGVSSNGGNITMNGGVGGASYAYGNTLGNSVHGIQINSGISTSGTGTINLSGHGYNGGGSHAYGLFFNSGSISSASGAVTLNGTGGATTANTNHGIQMQYSSISTGNGNINLTGTGNGSGTGAGIGVQVVLYCTITSSGTGTITFNGTGATNASSSGPSHGVQYNGTPTGPSSSVSTTYNVTAGLGGTPYSLYYNNGNTVTTGTMTVNATGTVNIINTTIAGPLVINAGANKVNTGTIDGGFPVTINAGTISPSGAWGSGTALSSVLFNTAFTLGGNLQTTTTGTTAFPVSVDGAYSLTATANYITAASLGSTTALSSISLNSATTIAFGGGGTVKASGAVSTNNPVTFSGDDLTFQSGTTLTLGGTVNGAYAFNFNAPNINGNGFSIFGNNGVNIQSATTLTGDLNITKDPTFSGTVNGAKNLTINCAGGCNVNGNGFTFGGVTPLSSVTFGSAIILTEDFTSISSGTTNISSTVDGAKNFNITSTTITQAAAIGATTPLTNLTFKQTSGTLSQAQNIKTTTGGISLTTSGAASDITLSGTLVATTGAITLSSYRDINVNNTITTSGGAINLYSDNASNSSGGINFGANITSGGGNILMGGGPAGAGYAYSRSANVGGISSINFNIDASNGASGGNITMKGHGINSAGTRSYGINLEGSTVVKTTGTGNISITGQAGGPAGTSQNRPIFCNTCTVQVTGGAGTVTMTGFGSASATGTNNVGIYFNVANIKTDSGALTLTGTGGASGSGNDYGIYFFATTVSTTGGGAINMTGTAGAATNSASGLYLNANIFGSGGDITLTGNGGGSTGTGSSNYGINTAAGGISNTGSGKIIATGVGGGTAAGSSNDGIYINGFGNGYSTVNGSNSFTGTGGLGNNNSRGVYITNTVLITTSGTGAIAITGTGGGSAGTNHGVLIDTGITINSSGNTTKITGKSGFGGNDINLSQNIATTGTTYLQSMCTQTGIAGTVCGQINVNLTPLTLAGNMQIYAYNSTSNINYVAGNSNTAGSIVFAGNVTGNYNLTMASGQALALPQISTQSITATTYGAAADITTAGTQTASTGVISFSSYRTNKINNNLTSGGGNITLTSDNASQHTGANIIANNINVTSGGGNITMTGGSGYSFGDLPNTTYSGIWFVGNNTVNAGGGSIIINGKGGFVDYFGLGGSAIYINSGTIQTATPGSISINGQNVMTQTYNGNIGVNLISTTVQVTSGAGMVNITGQGGSGGTGNYGVYVNSSSTILSTGTLSLSGTGGATGSGTGIGLYVTGNSVVNGGTISLTGTGGGTAGVNHGLQIDSGTTINSGANTTTITGQHGFGGYDILLSQNITSTGTTYLQSYCTQSGAGGTVCGEIDINLTPLTLTGDMQIFAYNAPSYANYVAGNTNTAGSIVFTGNVTGNYNLTMAQGIALALPQISTKSITATTYGAAADITTSGTQTSSTGVIALSSYRDVTISQVVTSSAGGAITLTSDNASNSSGAVNVSANITSNGGNITMTGGSGYAYGRTDSAGGVTISGAYTVNAGGGNITMNGKGYAGSVGADYGIYNNGGTIQTTGTGKINITGIGGGSNNVASIQNYGIYHAGTIQLSAGNVAGAINITGTGANYTGEQNDGIRFFFGSVISDYAPITIIGTGGLYSHRGISTQALTITSTNAATINITGTSGTNAITNGVGAGIAFYQSSITGSGGTITMNGTGGGSLGAGGSNNDGISLADVTVSNTTAAINMTGIGGGNAAGNSNGGISIYGASSVSTTTGAISLTGTGGAGTGASNGVELGSPTSISSTGNTMSITGTGGGTSGANHGVVIHSGTTINSVGNATNITGQAGFGGKDIYLDQNITTTGTTNLLSNCAPCGTIYINNAYTLAGPMVVNAGATGTFQTNNTLDGAKALQVTAATITPSGDFGSGVNLTSATFSSSFTLGGNLKVTTSPGATSFAGTINGNYTLNVNSPTITLGGHIGTGTKLSSVTLLQTAGALSLSPYNIQTQGAGGVSVTTNAGNITLGGTYSATSGPVSIAPSTSAITLAADTTITASTTATIGGSVTGIASNFTVTAGNTLSLPQINTKSITATTNLAGGDITTTGTQTAATGLISFSSYRSININNSLTTTNAVITLTSDNASQLLGAISIIANITSNGGNITLTGGSGYAYGTLAVSGIGAGANIDATGGGGTGAIVMNGKGYNSASAVQGLGVSISANVKTSAGNISISGFGSPLSSAAFNYGINVAGATISSSAGGTITINGTGGGNSGGSGYGVHTTTTIIQNTTGAINISGIGGSTGTHNHGILIELAGNSITTTGGSITMMGTGNGTASDNQGILIQTGNIVSSAAGATTLTGLAGVGGNDISLQSNITTTGTTYLQSTCTQTGLAGTVCGQININLAPLTLTGDMQIFAYNATTYANYVAGNSNTAGSVVFTGNITGNHNLTMASGQTLSLPTISTLSIKGTTYGAGADITTTGTQTSNGGVITLSAYRDTNINNALNTTSSANITLTSNNAASGSGAIAVNANISSNGGNIAMNGGVGGAASAIGYNGNEVGVTIGAITINALGGNISIKGSGYLGGAVVGVEGILLNASTVQTNGAGTISLTGTGGNSSGNWNAGIHTGLSTISSVNGNISLIGNGGGAVTSGANNFGIYHNGTISSTNGSIALTGTAGLYGAVSVGVYLENTHSTSTTGTGSITITGTGATNGTSSANGVHFNGGGTLSAAGTGTINITGTGSSLATISSSGVNILSGSTINSSGNTTTITGQYGTGGYDIYLNQNITTTGTTTLVSSCAPCGTIYINNAYSLAGPMVINAGATGIFQTNNTIDGNKTLGITANTITPNGAWGSGVNLGNLTFSSAFSLGNNLTTTSSGTTNITSTVNGAKNLIINSNAITQGGNIGSGTALTSATLNSAIAMSLPHNISVTGALLAETTAGNITTSATYTSTGGTVTIFPAGVASMILAADTTINAPTITIATAIDGTVNYNESLTLTSTGTITLGGAIGGSVPLKDVSITAGNTTTLPAITANSIFVKTTGAAANIITSGNLDTSLTTGTGVVPAATIGATNVADYSYGVFLYPGLDLDNSGAYTITTKAATYWAVMTGDSAITNIIKGGLVAPQYLGCSYVNPITCTTPALVAANGLNAFLFVASTINLTISGTSIINKVYDGTSIAYLNQGSLVGVLLADIPNVILTENGSYAQVNVGNGITVYISASISGSAASSYTLTAPGNLIGNIYPRPLTVTGTVASDKVYDSTTSATISSGVLNNVVAGETLTLTQAGTFASSNAGNGIGINMNDSISGVTSANYTLTQPTGITANITPSPLSVVGTIVADKVYDSTTKASLSGGNLSGTIYSGDIVNLTQSGNFVSKNVGNGVAVIASDTVDNANYEVVQPEGLSASISKANLTVKGTKVAEKLFSINNLAELSGGELQGIYAGDDVSLVESGYFTSLNTGKNLVITTDIIKGADAGNYNLIEPQGLYGQVKESLKEIIDNNLASLKNLPIFMSSRSDVIILFLHNDFCYLDECRIKPKPLLDFDEFGKKKKRRRL